MITCWLVRGFILRYLCSLTMHISVGDDFALYKLDQNLRGELKTT